jgi:hypothetical protein
MRRKARPSGEIQGQNYQNASISKNSSHSYYKVFHLRSEFDRFFVKFVMLDWRVRNLCVLDLRAFDIGALDLMAMDAFSLKLIPQLITTELLLLNGAFENIPI